MYAYFYNNYIYNFVLALLLWLLLLYMYYSYTYHLLWVHVTSEQMCLIKLNRFIKK